MEWFIAGMAFGIAGVAGLIWLLLWSIKRNPPNFLPW